MTPSITIPAPVAAPPRARSSAAVWIGGIVALVGVTLAIAGGAILVVFGEDSTLSSDPHALSTMTAALVSGTATIDDTADVAQVLGRPRIKIAAEADGERGVFVGIGRRADVDRYLANAPISEVTDLELSPWRLERRTRRGSATLTPPVREDFWVAKSSGEKSAAIDWKVRDGNYRAVVMNADGSRDVATHGTFGVNVPHISPIGLGILIGGLAVMVLGVAIAVIGRRRLL